MYNLIYITGGARSGKSTFAEKMAIHYYKELKLKNNIAYIATGLPVDDEFKNRINAHKKRRDKMFTTYEEPIKIDEILKECLKKHNIVLLECLTTWLGNVYENRKINNTENFAFKAIENILQYLSKQKNMISDFNQYINHNENNYRIKLNNNEKLIIAVSNEIGLGIVPSNTIIRNFRDELGKVNQMMATSSDHSFLLTSGIPIKIK